MNTSATKKLDTSLKAFIVSAIYEVLDDPDFGLELSEKAKKRLRHAITSKKRTVPFSAIKKSYY